MNNTIRTIMVWLVIGVILTMVFMQVGNRATNPNIVDYSTFLDEARQGRIATLVVEETFEVAVRIDTQDQVQPTSDVTAPDVIDDIVDETIEVVLQRGGNVVIVPDGTLSSHDRIAAVVRY